MFEDFFRFFMDTFNPFHDNYRTKIKAGEWKANFRSEKGKTIAGLHLDLYQISGGYGQNCSINLADFTDFGIILQTVNKNKSHLNRKFEIREMSIRSRSGKWIRNYNRRIF